MLVANQKLAHETSAANQLGSMTYRPASSLSAMTTCNDMLPRNLLSMVPQNPATLREANSQHYHDARALPDDQLR